MGATKRGEKRNKSQATIVNKSLETFPWGAPLIIPQVKMKNSQTIRACMANTMAAADISGAVQILA